MPLKQGDLFEPKLSDSWMHLDLHTITAAALVCRAWLGSARRVLFQSVPLFSPTSSALFRRTAAQQPSLVARTVALTLEPIAARGVIAEPQKSTAMIEALEVAPNVRRLAIADIHLPARKQLLDLVPCRPIQ